MPTAAVFNEKHFTASNYTIIGMYIYIYIILSALRFIIVVAERFIIVLRI